MRSATEDRTARAIIRDEALRLFAERNSDAVTVRDIAAAAGVSPALVLRHYGSKDGLRAAVDEHVVAVFAGLFDEVAPTAPGADAAGLAEQIARRLPAASPVPAYLARLLITADATATALFARLLELSRDLFGAMVASGRASDGADPLVRAAFLLVNDLGVILLRPVLTSALGFDPLSPAGLHRWARQVLAVYDGGLGASTPDASAPDASAPDGGGAR
jgi:AcrR family transcriptional regulator